MMDTPSPPAGSVFGGILLVAGCCIGAGMLGLPVLSAQAGFWPSLVVFLVCWLFMLCTGLLLLEVNLHYGGKANLITMAGQTLGVAGKVVAWLVFVFLFYSLMVAYVAASGALTVDFIEEATGFQWSHRFAELFFCLLFGILLYLGTGTVDRFNRFLMVGLILSYVVLVSVGAPHVQAKWLERRDWSAMTAAIPAVLISFGFHNLVPSLTTYFAGDASRLKRVLIVGSSVPFFVYVVWEWLIIGIVPLQGFQQALEQGEIATESLKNVAGSSWISGIAQSFAFFAIVTSFLGVALSFVDFLSDGLSIRKTTTGKLFLALLAMAPPFVCAWLYPDIFLVALNAAGGFGAVILFGILPALMVWRGRYMQKWTAHPLVPGGKPLLLAIMAFASWVILLQFL